MFDRTTAECLTNHNEEEVQRRCHERQQEIEQMQQVLETKIQFLQEVKQRPRRTPVAYTDGDTGDIHPRLLLRVHFSRRPS